MCYVGGEGVGSPLATRLQFDDSPAFCWFGRSFGIGFFYEVGVRLPKLTAIISKLTRHRPPKLTHYSRGPLVVVELVGVSLLGFRWQVDFTRITRRVRITHRCRLPVSGSECHRDVNFPREIVNNQRKTQGIERFSVEEHLDKILETIVFGQPVRDCRLPTFGW